MALLDLQEMELPETPSEALLGNLAGSSHCDGGGSNVSLLLCR